MPASKAQQKAVSKYMKENYDVYQIRMKKGQKDDIKAVAAAVGESINQYIINAIDQRKEQDTLPKDVIFGRTVDVIANHYEVSPWDVLDKLEGLRSTESQSEAAELALEGVVVSLPTDTLKAAQEAAEAAGEAVLEFVARAVDTQTRLDKASLAMGINPTTGGKQEKGA